MKRLFFLLNTLFLFAIPVHSQSIVGDWNGAFDASVIMMRVGLHVADVDGKLQGTLDLIDQAVNGISLVDPKWENNHLSFTSGLGVAFEGDWMEGDSIVGKLIMGKATEYPITFKRGKLELKRPQTPEAPFPYRIEDVTYVNPKAEGVTLAGTITIPAGEGPFPFLVLISGSGPNNRDEEILTHKPFWVIADYLSRRGIGVLRYDDRGIGKSTGNFATATGLDFASDAGAGVQYLLSRKDLPIKFVGIGGHSEGGLLAPQVAFEHPAVAFIVGLAGTGMTGSEVMYQQTKLVLLSMGTEEKAAEQKALENKRLYDIAAKNSSTTKVRQKLKAEMEKQNAVAVKAGEKAMTAQEINGQISTMTTTWFRGFLRYDPHVYLRKTRIPFLALNGSKDIQVEPKSNLGAIEAALKTAGNTRYEIHELEGLNHLFQHCQACSVAEYAQLEETFSPEALELICNWILKLP